MFCVYESLDGSWLCELVDYGKVKLTSRGKTPVEAVEKIFNMIGEDNEPESTSSTEENGAVPCLPSGTEQPPNCS